MGPLWKAGPTGELSNLRWDLPVSQVPANWKKVSLRPSPPYMFKLRPAVCEAVSVEILGFYARPYGATGDGTELSRVAVGGTGPRPSMLQRKAAAQSIAAQQPFTRDTCMLHANARVQRAEPHAPILRECRNKEPNEMSS